MANLTEQAKIQIDFIIRTAYERAVAASLLPEGGLGNGGAEIPKEAANGDFAANHAMAGAKSLKMQPQRIARALADCITLGGTYFSSVRVAGPGFINFKLSDDWYGEVLRTVESEGAEYGRSEVGAGKKLMVEFVSANPTGPMTIGNARGGVLGDSLARVLDRAGYDVRREFFVNDAGNQTELFGMSVEAAYLQSVSGEDAARIPENGYHGDDIKELAAEIYERDGAKYATIPPRERREYFKKFGIARNTELMRKHLLRYGIVFDEWFSESGLHESGYVEETVRLLTDAGHTYEKDGALWLKNTALGADKDEVLRRSNGFYTYYAADIAYHRNKFVLRGFDRVINVWGADHHGHAVRFSATLTAPELGLGDKRPEFLIMQMVRLVRGEEVVKVSKRTGKALALNELLDEIGVDACRFFFNSKPDTHLEFDLDLAVRRDSENPVYYVQYAHARICSLIAMLAAEGFAVPRAKEISAALFETEQEKELIKQLAALPDEIRMASRDLDPSRINRYVIELAARFHKFYGACRIKGEREELLKARLALADAVRRVIGISLSIIGVGAPEKM